jgi:hypothetical protein
MKLYTEPAFVRQVLDHYERHGWTATNKEFGFRSNSFQRWVLARKELGPEWPTWEMQVEWEQRQTARRHNRARKAAYRKQRILTGKTLIEATGTQRRIQALQRLGWPYEEIADAAGLHRRTTTCLLGRQYVTRETARRVDMAYRRLSMQVGPSIRVAIGAERKGWPPPLAWDCIDDPAERPKGVERDRGRNVNDVDTVIVERLLLGERMTSTRAEKEEAMRRWVADGKPIKALCVAHGWYEARYVKREAAS